MQNRLSIIGLAVTLPFWLAMLAYELKLCLENDSLKSHGLTPFIVLYILFPVAAFALSILNGMIIRLAGRVPKDARTLSFLTGRRRLVISIAVVMCSLFAMSFHTYRHFDELFSWTHSSNSGEVEERKGKYYVTQHGTVVEEISREQYESAQYVNRSAGELMPIFMITAAILLFMNVTRRQTHET
jgi:hypothetical protein